MNSIDTRFALIADNDERLYPYMKTQESTNRYGYALTAPGEQDRHGAGTYTEDLTEVIRRMVFDGWSVRAKSLTKIDGRIRNGTFGLSKRVIVGYEISDDLAYLVQGAPKMPRNVKAAMAEPSSPSSVPDHASFRGDEDLAEANQVTDERTLREIMTRRGQPEFRKRLISAFKGFCCISGCKVLDVLEAAHIVPHAEKPDYSADNGLLLRADIHSLFDLNLIGVSPDGIVRVSPIIASSEYAAFEGRSIMETVSQARRARLEQRFSEFKAPLMA